MKGHAANVYVELPLKAFMKAYPQYADDMRRKYDQFPGFNFDDPNYIARMEIKNGATAVEVGYASDAEWTIGPRGDKKPSGYACMPDRDSYDMQSSEQKAEYIKAMKEYIKHAERKWPNTEMTLDEDTGIATMKD